MTWSCKAIDHGLTFFPDGKIGPSCQIAAGYLKPIDLATHRDRFRDLKTEFPPLACEKCVKNEYEGIPSYRDFFNAHQISSDDGIVFLDIRNTNQCNLKCRYCGPHFSNQWGHELGRDNPLIHSDLSEVLDKILTDDLQVIYFTGGEPMISADHWNILTRLIKIGASKKIKLMYNTNLTSLKYKSVDFLETWKNFAGVIISASLDAVGDVFNNIRSGADWRLVEKNLDALLPQKKSNITITVTCVISILNIWSLPESIRYWKSKNLSIQFIILEGPDYLALDVIPDNHKQHALTIIDECSVLLDDPSFEKARRLINNNQNQVLFRQCLSHILLLDSLRNENLFALLPFKDSAKQLIANNNEYR